MVDLKHPIFVTVVKEGEKKGEQHNVRVGCSKIKHGHSDEPDQCSLRNTFCIYPSDKSSGVYSITLNVDCNTDTKKFIAAIRAVPAAVCEVCQMQNTKTL
jgi:hypothetical protein